MCPPEFLRHLHQNFKVSADRQSGGSEKPRPPSSRSIAFNRVIDLTHTLTPEFPTYNGTVDLQIDTMKSFGTDGVNVKRWTVREHMGTHIDAPLHFSKDGCSCDEIPADDLVVPLMIIDITGRAAEKASTAVTPDDIAAFERKHGPISEGNCVAMRSGWGKHVQTPKYRNADETGKMHFPGWHVESIYVLLERKVTGLGVDTLSIDQGPTSDFAAHYAWLPAGRWAIEGLANLEELPVTGATLFVGAPKIAGATGGPSRVFALI